LCDENANARTVGIVIMRIINIFLFFVSGIALIAIIIGGVQYITSLGDEQKTARAKMIILYSVVGLIVVGLAAVTVNFVVNIF